MTYQQAGTENLFVIKGLIVISEKNQYDQNH